MKIFHISLFFFVLPLVVKAQCKDLYFTPYVSSEGSFKINFPGIPGYRMEKVKIANIELENHYFDIRDFMADTLFFTLRYTDYPPANLNSSMKSKAISAFFQDSRNEFLKSMDGQELSFNEIEFMDYPGYDLQVEVGDKKSVVTKRLLLIKNRVYVLKVFTPNHDPKENMVQGFLESFDLLTSIADQEPYNYLLDYNVPKPVLVDTVITLDPFTFKEGLIVVNHYTNWTFFITSDQEIYNTDKGQKIVDYYMHRGEKRIKSISQSVAILAKE